MGRWPFILVSLILLSSVSFAEKHTENLGKGFEIRNTEIYQINSKTLGRTYDVFVKLPHGYTSEKNAHKSYPVIYTNDGPYPFKVTVGTTHIRKMDKAILVGLSFAHGDDGMHSRVRDLTPVHNKSWTKYETGGASDYLTFMETELFPFVENKYRIDADNRIFAGQSLGGSFGAWVLLTKPKLFKSYILSSPSLWFKNRMIFELEEKYAANHTDLEANVFFATGEFETPQYGGHYNMVDDMVRFAEQLRSRKYPNLKIHDEVISGSIHESTFPVSFTKGLLWILTDFYKNLPNK